jgi:NDP-sugar pyrophosphorylase family protein
MKAMIFAAGIGSRLKAYTQNTPKCLMPLGGTPILGLVIARLKDAGVTEAVINIHHHSEQVIDYLKASDNFGIKIHLSHEPTLLNTGGGLKKVGDLFMGESCFFLHNADIHYTGDLRALAAAHSGSSAIATLGIMPIKLDSGLYFDPQRRLVGWSGEQQQAPNDAELFSFSGISVCSSEILSFMNQGEAFSIIEPFLKAARSTQRVIGAEIDYAAWVDIGSPERLEALRSQLDSKR